MTTDHLGDQIRDLQAQLAAERKAHEQDREKWMSDIAKGADLRDQLAAERERFEAATRKSTEETPVYDWESLLVENEELKREQVETLADLQDAMAKIEELRKGILGI